MRGEYHFYMDDSGPRDPDRARGKGKEAQGPDWFALGGLLINSKDTLTAKDSIFAFRQRWPQLEDKPFRSYDIRNKTNRFRWLNDLASGQYQAFMCELTELIISLPIHVVACVVDRPGYNKRYMTEYGPRRWQLCRTAFNVAVERAAKVALHEGARLRVYAERSDKLTEAQFKDYFDTMRKEGPPFNAINSRKYQPLKPEQLFATLFEFRIKTKQSPLMQFADLVLWPICHGGYNRNHRAYVELCKAGKLVDSLCTPDNGLQGIKYSCFD